LTIRKRRGTGQQGFMFARRSVTFEPEVDRLAHEVVGAAGFSAYVNAAVREKLRRDQMLRLLADLDAEYGPVDPKVQDEMNTQWKRSRSTPPR
jgi:hypothetical protein